MPEFAQHEELARAALAEITPVDAVGAYIGQVEEDGGAVSLLFEAAMPGYPGWRWTVSIATVEDAEPTVLEAELMPGEGSLLAPDWVPWSERLAEYKAAQEAEATGDDAEGESDEDSDDDDESDEFDDSDEDDDDDDEDDVLGNDVLHGGDLDGIDIDTLDDPADEDESDDDDADDDDSDDDAEDERTY